MILYIYIFSVAFYWLCFTYMCMRESLISKKMNIDLSKKKRKIDGGELFISLFIVLLQAFIPLLNIFMGLQLFFLSDEFLKECVLREYEKWK